MIFRNSIKSLYSQTLAFFKQGASPKALALSSTVGLLLGLFPVIGVTTVVMMALAWLFRLNLPLMLSLSYLIYPLQIILIIPFIRFGEWLFGAPPLGLTVEAIQATFNAGFFIAMEKLWSANVCAAAGWAVLAVPVGLGFYWLLVGVLERRVRKSEDLQVPLR